MIAVCPNCSADIPVDPKDDSDVLTCPSCKQPCAFDRPPAATPLGSPRLPTPPQPRAIERPADSLAHPGGWLFLGLLFLAAFIAGATSFENWLDQNPSMAEALIPWGRFYLAAIHFPVVITSVVLVTEGLLLFRQKTNFGAGMRYWWWWATATGAIAFFLSLLLARDAQLTLDEGSVRTHHSFALVMVAALFATLFVKIMTDAKPERSRALYRLLVLGATTSVLITAILGINMVLGDGYLFSKEIPAPLEQPRD